MRQDVEAKRPLIQKKDEHYDWFSTHFKVSLYALLCGCAIEMRALTETQFIYAYFKSHTFINETVLQKQDSETSGKNDSCQKNHTGSSEDYIQGLSSDWKWYIQLVTYAIGLPVVAMSGPISDQFGRKVLIIYNLVLTTISVSARTYIIYADINLTWYLIFCGVEGLAGSHYGFYFASSAMLADCTKPDKQRSFALTAYETMIGLGICTSQIAVGYLIKFTSFTYPFLISAILTVCICVLVICTLEEKRKPLRESSVTFCTIWKGICTLWTNMDSFVNSQRKMFSIFFLVFVIHHFPQSSYNTIRTLFTLGSPFCWSSVHIGWYGAGTYFAEYVSNIIFLTVFILCMKDTTITVLGCISNVALFVTIGFSESDWMIYLATAVGIMRILPVPLLRASLSRIVSPDKQGSLFANIYVFEALCKIGGSTVFNNIYHKTRPIFKGMTFFVMAGFPLCAALIMICMTCTQSLTIPSEIKVEDPAIQTKDNSQNIAKQSGT